jgi:predicted DCC family thiol-disulfide oxidoreductase YuxK
VQKQLRPLVSALQCIASVEASKNQLLRDFRYRSIFDFCNSIGTRLAQAFGIDPGDPDTNAVIHGGVAYFKSDAALTVLSHLPGWGWVQVFFAVPKPLRDAVYNLVARNRYRIFGKYDECFVPDASFRDRVMEWAD